jgi:hypothetical protein
VQEKMPKAHTTDIAWVAGVMPMFEVGLIARVVVGQFIDLVQHDDCRMLMGTMARRQDLPSNALQVSTGRMNHLSAERFRTGVIILNFALPEKKPSRPRTINYSINGKSSWPSPR